MFKITPSHPCCTSFLRASHCFLLQLEVQYDCLTPLAEDLEWKVIYVGSAESESHDQQLDSALVGPVMPGTYKFRMEAPVSIDQGLDLFARV